MDDEREYRSRKGDRRAHVAALMQQLAEAYTKTDPTTADSATNKDSRASTALHLVGALGDAVAGWAVDHVCGLALAGEKMLPLQPDDHRPGKGKKHSRYVEYRALADCHDRERAGGTAFHTPPTSSSARRLILRNLVFAGAGGFPSWLQQELLDALDALDAGKTMPLLEASKEVGTSIEDAKAMLGFVAIVKYQSKAYGINQDDARESVGQMIDRDGETLKSWERRLKSSVLGKLEVDQAISRARNAAGHVRSALRDLRNGKNALGQVAEHHERRYGHEALAALVTKWKEDHPD